MIRRRRVESDLGDWHLTELRPQTLAGFVDAIWLFEGALTLRRERHFPTGTLDLILHLGERFDILEGEPRGRCPTVCIGGILVRPQLIEAPPGRCRVLGVRLLPAGAHALLRSPLHEITGQTVDLGDLLGRAADELADRCHDAPSDEAAVRIAQAWLEQRMLRPRRTDPRITRAAAEIERLGGVGPIAGIREEIGLSRPAMASGFREEIGVTPKLFARIVRFRRLTTLLRSSTRPLSELALTAGYYDQPHMNAEFREMSGLSPRKFLAATHFPEASSLAE